MNLSTAEQILVEQRVTNEARSTAVAYLLWLFVGGLGAHRFYTGRVGSGVAILALFVIGVATVGVGIGSLILVAWGVWLLVDLFLIPGMIREQRDRVRDSLSKQIYAERLLAGERGES
ncbi:MULTISPECIES: TM2 domain-containing protein [unclassified Sinorhizobium]|uniref:TM2 domain-containing protein n=1 Tax=unclassified Sinorhizobium TaxID=2613772 RepID=UPI0024C2CFC3|nr:MULTISPECIES: TM2 domain-containing protein [unclassified Sinorhizobium]MDK1376771.1 TM2 domain-containing protein [Sinorhizobium sp. 6-70]MDK1479543.1 TM2 domain-containing protein [Sinorhizobium sp. 6-117]